MKLVNVIQWGNIYFVGACENHTFEAELEGQTDLGRSIVNAPKTMIDDRGRRIMLAGLFAREGSATLKSMHVWEMASISE